MRRTKEAAAETMNHLLQVARRHFTEHGYAKTSLELIAHEAEVTRGALYHHFRNKRRLFQVVLEKVQEDVANRVEAEASGSELVWEQLLLGCQGFLAAAIEPQNKRIMLIDGPAVLGWDEWRSMDERHSMRLLEEQLRHMQEQGVVKPGISVEVMTYSLSGAMNEMALWLAHRKEEAELSDAMETLALLLEGFKAT